MGKDWDSVATAINTRVGELGMKQRELAERSGVSVAAIRLLQKGKAPNALPRTLASVSVALQWPPGYLEALAAGGRLPTDPTVNLREEITELRAELGDVRERLAKVEAAQQPQS